MQFVHYLLVDEQSVSQSVDMPRVAKRNSDAVSGSSPSSGAPAKKAMTREEKNRAFFEKMTREAEEIKKERVAKEQAEVNAKTKAKDRRQTIAATSSSRQQMSAEKPKPGRKSIAVPTKSSSVAPRRKSVGVVKNSPSVARRRESIGVVKKSPAGTSRSTPESSEGEESSDSSSEEDEFDRLVARKKSHKSAVKPVSEAVVENEYAKVYSQTSRPPSKRQLAYLQRQKELYDKAQRGYHSSDDSESESESSTNDQKETTTTDSSQNESPVQTESAAVATVRGKDDMMMQIDAILYSIACTILGALLVFGVYYTLVFLESTPSLVSLPQVGEHVQGMGKRVAMLSVAVAMIFAGFEVFLWINRRANRRV